MRRVTVSVTVDCPDDLCASLAEAAPVKVECVLGGHDDVVIATSAGVTLHALVSAWRVTVGPEVTYLAAADISANEAAVFPALGEAFPAPNGWTYQSVIGTRTLLGEYCTESQAQDACDKWLAVYMAS